MIRQQASTSGLRRPPGSQRRSGWSSILPMLQQHPRSRAGRLAHYKSLVRIVGCDHLCASPRDTPLVRQASARMTH
eukprot:scaffold1624_cov403-Prasinococcus_capsulatus_cf.AAC.2